MPKKITGTGILQVAIFIYILFVEAQLLTSFNLYLGRYRPIILIGVIGLVVFKEIYKYTRAVKICISDVIKFILAAVLVLISYFAFKYTYGVLGIVSVLLMLSARDTDLKSVIKPFLYASGIVILFMIIFSKLHIISSYTLWDTGRVRNSMGFLYPAYPAHILFFWVSGYLYVRGKKVTSLEFIGLFLTNLYIYLQAYTKNPFTLTLVVILIDAIIVSKKRTNFQLSKLYKAITNSLFLVLPTFTVWFVNYAPMNILVYVNNLVNGRVLYAREGMLRYGVHLLGQNIHFITRGSMNLFNTYDYVDSGYVQSLLQSGVLYTVIILALYTFLMVKVNRQGDLLLSLILVLIAVYNMFDPNFMFLWFNPFLLGCGVAFSEKAYVLNLKSNIVNVTPEK